jgi:hypothetical protein
MGRELFDFAFKEYSQRWEFKRPTPSDFFRTMEEASGIDLDWFWRGWFYTTDHVDISVERVYEMRMNTEDPDIDFAREREDDKAFSPSLFSQRNREAGMRTWVERNTDVRDFYDENDQFTVTNKERNAYNAFLEGLEDWERDVLDKAVTEDRHYYLVEFANKGGLVMPIILDVEYADGATEQIRYPAEIWRRSPKAVKKLLVSEREIVGLTLDPMMETADADIENNFYPRRMVPSRIESFKRSASSSRVARDIMQDIKTELKTDDEASDEE